MWFSVLAGTLSVVLGSLLALLPGASARRLGPFQSFALMSSVAVVLGQLLPDALSVVGLPALLVFGAAFGTPRALEWLRARFSGAVAMDPPHGDHSHDMGPCSDVGLELGYGAFLLHSAADGVGLSVFGGGMAGVEHYDVALAIAAHTVPVTAMVIMAYEVRYGLTSALWRSAFVLGSTLVGMALPGALDPAWLHAVEPWLSAAAGGLLLHVVSHGWAPDAPPTPLGHLLDFLALLAAAALFLFGGGHSHEAAESMAAHVPEFRQRLLHAFWELGLETAPMLLLGLFIAAMLQVHGSRLSPSFMARGNARSQAVRGAVLGLPLPVCACGILPIAHSLRTRGAAPAFVVAFLISTPELGIDTFVLTGRFLGWPFAAVRLAAALAIAMIAALLLSSQVTTSEGCEPGQGAVMSSRPGGGIWLQTLHHFEDLLYHVGAWTLVGLLGAAYVEAVLDANALLPFAHHGLDVLVVSMLAVPSYVCASSATPLAAVLLHKGLSPGAVLVGLLLGPATNLATVAFLRKAYGPRATVFGIGGLLFSTWAIAYVVNTWLPVAELPKALTEGHTHGLGAYVSGALLVLLVLRAMWRSGLRTWLSSLGEVTIEDDAAEHAHAGHVHHGHGHHH